jgi:ribosomal protein S18 acetylase RimI-like enzyme
VTVKQAAGRRRAVSLRPVEPTDRDALVAIFVTTRERELALLPLPEPAWTAFVQQQFEAQDRSWRTAYPDASRMAVTLDGEVVGRFYVDRGAGALHIIEISLMPAHRGQGIGTHLLAELIAESEAAGIPLTLHVDRTNPAVRLYSRLGFDVVGDEGLYLSMRLRPGLS